MMFITILLALENQAKHSDKYLFARLVNIS